ncbi:unnamed protein product, partial [Ectocarpus sp. 12 AP-2014]
WGEGRDVFSQCGVYFFVGGGGSGGDVAFVAFAGRGRRRRRIRYCFVQVGGSPSRRGYDSLRGDEASPAGEGGCTSCRRVERVRSEGPGPLPQAARSHRGARERGGSVDGNH